ncbi:MAG: hypothetical protein M1829_006512 [Trizodia sp. TS-e1964]|nr:MAG: hypothetical protein M1829_006512 [Trizodia sp. TS-e1964]
MNYEDDFEDSLDELAYDTVATVPFSKEEQTQMPSSSPHFTQPTQLLRNLSPRLDSDTSSVIQVPASSPPRPLGANDKRSFANTMAPAATAFRAPIGVQQTRPKPIVIDISDDEGPTYAGDSSDDNLDATKKVDIRPSVFSNTGRNGLDSSLNIDMVKESPNNGLKKFHEITTNSFYNPAAIRNPNFLFSNYAYTNGHSQFLTGAKRSSPPSDSLRPAKFQKQTRPERSRPVEDISLDEIEDYTLRWKIANTLRPIFPFTSILTLKNTLLQTRGNADAAIQLLSSQDQPRTNINYGHEIQGGSVNRLDTLGRAYPRGVAQSSHRAPPKPVNRAKIDLIRSGKTIQDKYSSTQALAEPPSQSFVPAEKVRRRLIQGRRPGLESSPPNSSPLKPKKFNTDKDSDSGVASESEDDTQIELRLLDFLNVCSFKDLADIAVETDEIAELILKGRPFGKLDAVRAVEIPSTAKSGKRKPKNIGERVVSKSLEMWSGYEAVDALVSQCEALGKPIAEEMESWRLDIFGVPKDDGTVVTNLTRGRESRNTTTSPSTRDSGIGTPSHTPPQVDSDSDLQIISSSSEPTPDEGTLLQQPSIMSENLSLKSYQRVGISWLSVLYNKGLGAILADDMGLGKTCQIIAFLAHLLEKGVKGPHLVILPGSTLENWLREFKKFCPTLKVEPYYAGKEERVFIRDRILQYRDQINVVVTTYTVATGKDDNHFLRHLKPEVCVFDEGHILKSANTKRHHDLMRIPAKFRVLLTGTPLQNNLQELASLLGFILPSVFNEKKDHLEYIFKHKAKTTDENHSALLSGQRIARARSMMTPFVLRRKKFQVLKDLPGKVCRVEFCEPTENQMKIYQDTVVKAKDAIEARAAGRLLAEDEKRARSKEQKALEKVGNPMMQLRKAAIHPLLYRNLYTDSDVKKIAIDCIANRWQSSDLEVVREELEVYNDFELSQFCNDEQNVSFLGKHALSNNEWMDSGKVTKLCALLKDFKANGDRVLVFSQFTMVLDILESVMETADMKYFRLDGTTKIESRQEMIDQFYEDEEITVFLLSTGAGGSGINLAAANKVVIFDLSFNPQDDVQAENRAHRVGQVREVEVIRLVTKGTIEEQILALGQSKIALDQRVAGEEGSTEADDGVNAVIALKGEQLVAQMLLEKVCDVQEESKAIVPA